MSYCYRCGVELERNANVCPLCGIAVPDPGTTDARQFDGETITGYPPDVPTSAIAGAPIDHHQRRVVLTLFLLLPVPMIGLAWFIREPGPLWMVWAMVVLLALWIALVPLRRLFRWPMVYAVVVGVMGGGGVVGADALNGHIDWSVQIALPVSAVVFGAVGTLLRVTRGFRDWGLPALAVCVLGVALTAVVTDGLVNRFYGEPFVSGTYALLVVAVPTAAVSFYLQRRGVRVDLRRLFHM